MKHPNHETIKAHSKRSTLVPVCVFAIETLTHRAIFIAALKINVELPQTRHVLQNLLTVVGEMPVVRHEMAQRQTAIATCIHRINLNIRLAMMHVILPRQSLPHVPVTTSIMNGRYLERIAHVVIENREQ